MYLLTDKAVRVSGGAGKCDRAILRPWKCLGFYRDIESVR
jgi:hypothetical protein